MPGGGSLELEQRASLREDLFERVLVVDRDRQQQRGDRFLQPERSERPQQMGEPDHRGVGAHQHLAARDLLAVAGDHRMAVGNHDSGGDHDHVEARRQPIEDSQLGLARLAEKEQVERLQIVGRKRLDQRGGAGHLGEDAGLLVALRHQTHRGREPGPRLELLAQLLAEETARLQDPDPGHGSLLSGAGSGAPCECRSLPRSHSQGPLAA